MHHEEVFSSTRQKLGPLNYKGLKKHFSGSILQYVVGVEVQNWMFCWKYFRSQSTPLLIGSRMHRSGVLMFSWPVDLGAVTTNHSRRHRVSISNWGKYFFKVLWCIVVVLLFIRKHGDRYRELERASWKRKMERAASEHGNSNKIIHGEDTGIHSKTYFSILCSPFKFRTRWVNLLPKPWNLVNPSIPKMEVLDACF